MGNAANLRSESAISCRVVAYRRLFGDVEANVNYIVLYKEDFYYLSGLAGANNN